MDDFEFEASGRVSEAVYHSLLVIWCVCFWFLFAFPLFLTFITYFKRICHFLIFLSPFLMEIVFFTWCGIIFGGVAEMKISFYLLGRLTMTMATMVMVTYEGGMKTKTLNCDFFLI